MQKSQPPNKIYEQALIWFETQKEYKIDATIQGKIVEMKLFKNNELQKTTFEPFTQEYANVYQQKIINLYEYEQAKVSHE
jgi:hypothetical protein